MTFNATLDATVNIHTTFKWGVFIRLALVPVSRGNDRSDLGPRLERTFCFHNVYYKLRTSCSHIGIGGYYNTHSNYEILHSPSDVSWRMCSSSDDINGCCQNNSSFHAREAAESVRT